MQGAVGQRPAAGASWRPNESERPEQKKKREEGGAVGSATAPRRLREKEAAGQSFRLRE